jgi:hypothetical protein
VDVKYNSAKDDVAYSIKKITPYHGTDIAIKLPKDYDALSDAIRVVQMGVA